MVVRTIHNDQLIVMHTSTIEDYFENITVALCHLISNDPKDTVNPDFTEVDIMYSVKDIQ